jgi:hypothetical protein
MAFGKGKEEDVVSLIAAKKYARAIEVLKAQLQKKGANPSLRMQLADVLILADKKQEAISLLIPLADQFAREGFAAKAVSVLKKIQKIDPGRHDVEARLARQIEEKQREASSLPLARPGGPAPEIGGMEEGPSLEIGMEAMEPVSAAPSEPVRAVWVPPPPEAEPAPTPQAAAPVFSPPPEPMLAAEPLPTLELAEEPAPARAPLPPRATPPPQAAEPTEFVLAEVEPAAPAPAPVAARPAEESIEDYDLLYFSEDGEDEEGDVPLEAEIVDGDSKPAAEPMSAGQFADELMGLVDSVFQEFQSPSAAPAVAAAPAAPAAADEPHGGSQIVVSPLFRDFSVDEMVAVIQGLKLLSFERGAVILREGQGGGSLYMLTSGRVRAFKKSADGKQNPLGDLKEGAFFGEMSILTGHPRMASVVALARCELLELDRPTLDGITKTHPHVWDVLREFAEKRRVAAQG